MLASFCGTPNFAAPELFDNVEEYAGGPVDMWAVGITLHRTLTGSLPYSAASLKDLGTTILTKPYRSAKPPPPRAWPHP